MPLRSSSPAVLESELAPWSDPGDLLGATVSRTSASPATRQTDGTEIPGAKPSAAVPSAIFRA